MKGTLEYRTLQFFFPFVRLMRHFIIGIKIILVHIAEDQYIYIDAIDLRLQY